MQDRPTMRELIEAVQYFFQSSVAPLLTDPRTRFQGLIAHNVLEILKRELELGETATREEWRSLQKLLGASGAEPAAVADLEKSLLELYRTFRERARTGAFDTGEARAAAYTHARKVVVDKLKVTNPGYLTEPG
ncbi:MAG: hypothetical protein KIT79_07240 [Deltaproteobacteria bacterium]|nr:hypothetical protein [Deltaproteobacteria bacterium]